VVNELAVLGTGEELVEEEVENVGADELA